MITVAWKNRALPIYWKILNHKGASNLAEQQAVMRPVFKLLKKHKQNSSYRRAGIPQYIPITLAEKISKV
ncbi:hypothetical protein [Okeania sp. SIO1I7]|uniref:hypothetical protein n=1 Tax=Okeania sp. SIO1I7 TaxID=2607772 RepID=UPI0013F863C5|nr:hypothetical protein [Okeania sp. SIO1I7]NET28005.1 hypothetical protein [Okeania sp. SIO1I7]